LLIGVFDEVLGDCMPSLDTGVNGVQPFIHQYVQSLHSARCRSF
jgi:hypothetical protein